MREDESPDITSYPLRPNDSLNLLSDSWNGMVQRFNVAYPKKNYPTRGDPPPQTEWSKMSNETRRYNLRSRKF